MLQRRVKRDRKFYLSENIGQFTYADANDCPGDDEDTDDKFGSTMDFERRSSLEVVFRASDRRVVVANEEGFSRFGEESRREEEANATEGERYSVPVSMSLSCAGRNMKTHKGTKAAKTNSSQRRLGQATVSKTVTTNV